VHVDRERFRAGVAMFYKYIITSVREILEVSAPNDEAAVARIKELLPNIRGAEPYDPKWFFPQNTDHHIHYAD